MTMLDDRAGIARLSSTPLSIVAQATDRFEVALEDLGWDIWDHADADTFKAIKKDAVREKIADTLNEAGEQLHAAVIKLLRGLEDEVEMEMMRLD